MIPLLAALLWPLGIFPETIPGQPGNLTSLSQVEQCPSGVYSCTLLWCPGQDCNTCECLPGFAVLPEIAEEEKEEEKPRESWPAPCADAGTCWLAWGPPRVDYYEVWARGVKCATLTGHRKPNGGWVNPRQWYQPRPGDGCWRPGQSAAYSVRACTDNLCGAFGDSVEFGPQEFMCFNFQGPIPCEE